MRFNLLEMPTAKRHCIEKMLNLLDEIQFVQDIGQYPDWIAQLSIQDQLKITDCISNELKALQERTSFERLNQLDHVLYYYSDSRHWFQKTAIELHEKIGYSRTELEEGRYDPNLLASRLIAGITEYDQKIIVPIIRQIENELINDFAQSNILFLGRDFTSVYTYASATRNLKDIYLSNVSRKIRDAATNGKFNELRLILEQIGLTKERLLDKGLVICDSSRMGKVPAVIFKAIAYNMNPRDAYSFLTNVHVRYMYSLCNKGMTIAEKARDLSMSNQLPQCQIEAATKTIDLISEFKIKLPEQVEKFIDQKHMLMEWRPKAACISQDIETKGNVLRFSTSLRQYSYERIQAFLGLSSEINILQAGKYDRAQHPDM